MNYLELVKKKKRHESALKYMRVHVKQSLYLRYGVLRQKTKRERERERGLGTEA